MVVHLETSNIITQSINKLVWYLTLVTVFNRYNSIFFIRWCAAVPKQKIRYLDRHLDYRWLQSHYMIQKETYSASIYHTGAQQAKKLRFFFVSNLPPCLSNPMREWWCRNSCLGWTKREDHQLLCDCSTQHSRCSGPDWVRWSCWPPWCTRVSVRGWAVSLVWL